MRLRAAFSIAFVLGTLWACGPSATPPEVAPPMAVVSGTKPEPIAAPTAAPSPPSTAAKEDPLAANGYSLGEKSAPVTIVEFADYECPFCAAEQPVIKKLLDSY